MNYSSLVRTGGLLALVFSPFPTQAMVDDIPTNYSFCGYHASEDSIPHLPILLTIAPGDGDRTNDLQEALDRIASLPLKEGIRGAVQLEAGDYLVSGRLEIHSSGIVLRGAGADQTRLILQGVDRAPAILIEGSKSELSTDTLFLQGSGTWNYAPGTEIEIVHPSTKEWIKELGCDIYGGGISALGWKPGDVDVHFRRTVITPDSLNVPIPMHWGENQVYARRIVSNGRISQSGVEHLTIQAEVTSSNPKDEQHLWTGISLDHAEDCWVSCVNFESLSGSGVIVQADAQRITVEDCIYRHPVSEEANHRRNAFYVLGQQTLVQRCVADRAMHAFATGWAAAGPNAFVQCEAREALSYSGAVDAWSTGLLMDIVDIDGHDLMMANIDQDNNGAGWTAANGTCWQCSAAEIHCYSPNPENANRAYGTWCQFSGNGIWKSTNNHLKPRSLYYAQLAERNPERGEAGLLLPRSTEASSSPTEEVAMASAMEVRTTPRLTLEQWVLDIQRQKAQNVYPKANAKFPKQKTKVSLQPSKVTPQFGFASKVTLNGAMALGGKYNTPWWNGKLRPNYLEKKAQPALTRFVPDREGLGLTDRVDSVVDYMQQKNMLAYDQWYGLWYERRRDDHERIRRRDAECWGPFYEMPWARSGEGTAWEGLSRYDLTKPNLWYYGRLQEFCRKAPNRLLYLEHYFQHNILEAGAHWVDSPWRPVNNVNGTVFPEPVPFTGDKRVFVAEWFYDEQNPTMRQLHRQYIRENLEQMRHYPNVVHHISSEYTGPLHFTRFWLECIAEWEQETGCDTKVALACTKDVQDSILADPELRKVIDIIEIQYWFYKVPDKKNPKDIWDPRGGLNMAPRQHMRRQNVGKTGFEEAYRSVYEYTSQYPDKAVTFYAQQYPTLGWAILMAGGSCCEVGIEDRDLLRLLPEMRPINGDTVKQLVSSSSALLYFTADGEAKVTGLKPGKHVLMKLSHEGKTEKAGSINVSANGDVVLAGKNNEIYWIK